MYSNCNVRGRNITKPTIKIIVHGCVKHGGLIPYNELRYTVVLCGIPTNENVDESTVPHGSGETTHSITDNK